MGSVRQWIRRQSLTNKNVAGRKEERLRKNIDTKIKYRIIIHYKLRILVLDWKTRDFK